jgi:hypothetical protein
MEEIRAPRVSVAVILMNGCFNFTKKINHLNAKSTIGVKSTSLIPLSSRRGRHRITKTSTFNRER